MSSVPIEMGICWSEPPVQQPPMQTKTPLPSAPPYPQQYVMYPPQQQQQQQQQYTYAAPQQQQYQQYQYQQPQMYTYAAPRPQYYPPQQQQQMGTGTAVLGGFVLGAMMEDMLDPTE
jgi:hypothetical protein